MQPRSIASRKEQQFQLREQDGSVTTFARLH
jgi:hypothetical protein